MRTLLVGLQLVRRPIRLTRMSLQPPKLSTVTTTTVSLDTTARPTQSTSVSSRKRSTIIFPVMAANLSHSSLSTGLANASVPDEFFTPNNRTSRAVACSVDSSIVAMEQPCQSAGLICSSSYLLPA
ncbi:unnamed protein product [Protopolystoma xenopodis]|uniref:Uncharacterized protein n=1 Tax=Protopolystoma xenopodis TaxID=117903 RepID=A0A3S5AUW9_9PLAT|nr:unnamed protein product [Protopolystoma xenopodis]